MTVWFYRPVGRLKLILIILLKLIKKAKTYYTIHFSHVDVDIVSNLCAHNNFKILKPAFLESRFVITNISGLSRSRCYTPASFLETWCSRKPERIRPQY